MTKILLVTVGGSPAPIIRSIKEYHPDFVYFICSEGPLPRGTEELVDGKGDPCGDKRKARCPKCGEMFFLGDPKGKSIVFQTGLEAHQYRIWTVSDPDDLTECYTKLKEISEEICSRFPGENEIVANYTGGTKTMSVALAYSACLNRDWKLALNVGPRTDVVKVRGHDVFITLDKSIAIVDYELRRVKDALAKYDYSQAESILRDLLKEPLDQDRRKELLTLYQKIRGFRLWDQFKHREALELISIFGGDLADYIFQIKDILGQLKKGNPYAKVADLINNSLRRKHQGRYDDAVARLYRATEMFGQIALDRDFNLDPNFTIEDLSTVNTEVAKDYQGFVRSGGRVLLGLDKTYSLLFDLGHVAGEMYQKERKRVLNALARRNNSILAHGSVPLTENDFQEVYDIFVRFLKSCAESMGIALDHRQLPTEWLLNTKE